MPDTFIKIATVTVGSGGSSTIDFTSIPSTYTDLCLLTSTRGTFSNYYDEFKIRFNGSTTGYTARNVYGSSTGVASGTFDAVAFGVGSTATANTFSNNMLYIPNYAGSTNKSLSSDFVGENNATTTYLGLYANLWSNTAAITSISLSSVNTSNFVQYSTATLYGIANT
jgi:hypothetical protein